MWKRKTFYECASELRSISDLFKSAYLNRHDWDDETRNSIMVDTSKKGVEILRTLALAVRSEQDYGMTTDIGSSVGIVKSDVTSDEVDWIIQNYSPSFVLNNCNPLSLRQGLNKLAHAEPTRSGYYVSNTEHTLILSGKRGKNTWVAILSITKLCETIETLPDISITRS